MKQVKIKKLFVILVGLFFALTLNAQNGDENYIPKNLDEAITQLDILFADSTKNQIINLTEEKFLGNTHFSTGMWIRNNWGLWKGKELAKYFNDLGIFHADDMSGIILTSYYRYLHNQDLRIEEQISYYQEYWENIEAKELQIKQQEFTEYRVGDTLEYRYNKGFVSDEQEDKYYKGICIAKGIITETNKTDFLIKVKVIETCDDEGIIYYDNDGGMVYDFEAEEWINPLERIIEKMKINEEQWFEYEEWEVVEEINYFQ